MAPVSCLFYAYLTSFLFISVSSHQSRLVVIPGRVTEDQRFTVYCDASRVNEYDDIPDDAVHRLYISRNLISMPGEHRIAEYNANESTRTFTNNPPGRDWKFRLTGDKAGVNNKDTMRILWQVRDARCQDAGTYFCRVYYNVDGKEVVSVASFDININAKGPMFNLSVEPYSSELQYSDGELVTITCKVKFSYELKFKWKKWVLSSSGRELLPADSVIDENSQWDLDSESGCDFYEMQSRLEVQVRNEQETYQCIVYDSNNNQEISRKNITIVSSQEQQPVVIPREVIRGQPFSVYCDASRVTLDPGFSDIFLLQISWRSLSDSLLQPVAVYNVTPGSAPTLVNNPDGRDWNFTFTGDNRGVNNRETMKIVWEVRDAMCEDAGIYQCTIGYFSNGLKNFSTKTVIVIFNDNQLFLDLSADPYSRELQYREGEIVKYTCKQRGHNRLNFKWEKWVTSSSGTEQLESLPNDAVIVDTPESPVNIDNCTLYDTQSILEVRAQSTYQKETYKCIVLKNNQELIRRNITIDVLPQQRPIINVDDLIDVDTFTITCDTSRVIIPPSRDRPISISELAIEARLGSSQTFHKIAQYVACGPLGNVEYQNNAPGRDCVFKFTGSNAGDKNLFSMRIAIQVRDPRYTDAGLYRCTVRYFSDQGGVVGVSHEHNLTALTRPIVKGNIERRRPFMLICDAWRVSLSGYDVNPDLVGALVVQAKLGTNRTYTKVAEYLSYGPQEYLQFQNPPAGGDWVFKFTGSNNGVNNSKTMRLVIEVREARCDDAGMYMCQVMFYSSEEGTVWLHQEQNVTVCE